MPVPNLNHLSAWAYEQLFRGEHALLLAAWLVFFLLHSTLASLAVKNRVAASCKGCLPFYRLFFNTSSLLGLALPHLVAWRYPGEPLWTWSGSLQHLPLAVFAIVAATFLYSLLWYDIWEFIGVRQLLERVETVEDQERFRVSPLHRFVRHPWYTLAIALMWTRNTTTTKLVSNVLQTAYFVLGSQLEEQKLVSYYGSVYERYQKAVPGILPLPWRFLTPDQARELVASQKQDREKAA